MTDQIKTDYTANSHKSKEEPKVDSVEKTESKFSRITTDEAIQKKKSLSSKIAESFTGDDATSVGNYVLFDVILPNVKTMVSEAVSQGIERMLFGDTKRRSASIMGRGNTGYTSYNRMHSASPGRAFEPDEPRQMSRRGRAMHDFKEIVIRDRGEAEMILATLTEGIETFGIITVADLYDLAGITGSFTDRKYGWTDLRDSRVRRVSDGYLLDLPNTVQVD